MKKIFALMCIFCSATFFMLEAQAETIDFESIAPGSIVCEVYGDGGTGPIGVTGTNAELDILFPPGPNNAAVIFDSSNPPGIDFDLGTPNENCPAPGPGVGDGGKPGEPYENCSPLGHLLIINEALKLADNVADGTIDCDDSPALLTDDADLPDSPIIFDFSGVGPVTVTSITLIDVEAVENKATVEFFDGLNTSLALFELPQTGDNGVAVVSLGPTSGVSTMEVTLKGSGAIDNIVFAPPVCGNDILDPGEECDGTADEACPGECKEDCTCPEGGGEGCTPGYWKQEQHFDSWTSPYVPDGDTPTTFLDAFGCAITIMGQNSGKGKPTENTDPTLLEALNANGGGCSALARHAVAALLNAASSGVSYSLTVDEIKTQVCAAIANGECESVKDTLAAENELGCPLNSDPPPPPPDDELPPVDTDQDGIDDDEDICPTTPNGPAMGSCFNYWTHEVWGECLDHDSCRVDSEWYRWCDYFQNDMDGDGLGDVCDN